jgi:ketosteroid isomerase-like protein
MDPRSVSTERQKKGKVAADPLPFGAMAEAPHPHVLLYRKMIAAFNANRIGEAVEIFHPDVVYTIPGKSPIAGQTRGIEAHLEMLRRIRERSGGTLRLEPRSVLADDVHLLIYGRVTAQREGKGLDTDHCVAFRFEAGRIVEGRTIPVDLYAFDDFWS